MPPGMSTARQPPESVYEKPVTVLVTGFGPFLDQFPKNTSWAIASSLPALLLPDSSHSHPPIRILVHHQGVRVAYQSVLELIPTLLSPPATTTALPTPDVVLHLGLAAGRKFYTLEKLAKKRGYGRIPDVDGNKFPDKLSEERWPSNEYPDLLKTGFHTETIYSRWRSQLPQSDPDFDVRTSEDAGNFMCEFIYWNSLAHNWSKRGLERPVMFLHVPDLPTEEKLEKGRQVTIAMIRALVESWKKFGTRDQGQDGVGVGAQGAQIESKRAQKEDEINGERHEK